MIQNVITAVRDRAAKRNPRWAARLDPALDRLRRLADAGVDRAELARQLELEQEHALFDPDWLCGSWRLEQLSPIREALETDADRAELARLAARVSAAMAGAR